jgi:NAD(P)-dependent dehydrogenase (short-subunit alcohol dehydrogenase family)
MTPSVHRGTALIIGGSRGLGAVYADRLARRGYDLFLVARNPVRLHEIAYRLTTETCRSVETLAVDVTGLDGLSRVTRVLQTDSSMTLLLDTGLCGPAACLGGVAAPAFAARGCGAIITVATCNGASVCATNRALMLTLRGTDVRVQTVLLLGQVGALEATVDAALAGLDRGDAVTMPLSSAAADDD